MYDVGIHANIHSIAVSLSRNLIEILVATSKLQKSAEG